MHVRAPLVAVVQAFELAERSIAKLATGAEVPLGCAYTATLMPCVEAETNAGRRPVLADDARAGMTKLNATAALSGCEATDEAFGAGD